MEFTHLTGMGGTALSLPPKNAAVVIYGIKLAAEYLCADAFNKMLLCSESPPVSSQKGPFIVWSITGQERGINVFQCELLVRRNTAVNKQGRGWNVRRQGQQPKEAESVGEQEEFPQNSWFSYCIAQ